MSEELDTMDENSQTILTREDIEEGVRNWKNRLNTLFKDVNAWAVNRGWRVDNNSTVGMDEELMREFGVPATEQPTLRLDRNDDYALFKPKGLWVIGANGRIDLYTSKGTFIILDLAEQYSPPQWRIYRASNNRNGDPFTPEMIEGLI